MERVLQQQCVARGWTVAVAESCTGGLITDRLTNVSGSSRYMLLGIVAYHQRAKSHLLRVPAHTLRRFGSVSAAVARAMALGVRQQARATFGVGVTGIAGPTGGTPRKPVGTVFIAVARGQRARVRRYRFRGTRRQIKRQAADAALRQLRSCMS